MTSQHRSRTGFWILIGLLAASGLAMAGIVVFGLFDSVAYSLVWRVFVADLYLIAALTAQHTVLRWTAWTGIVVTLVLGVINTIRSYSSVQSESVYSDAVIWGDPSTGWSPWSGFLNDLELACHLAMAFVIGLCILSLAYRWLAGERVLMGIYWFTCGAAGVSAVLGFVLAIDGPDRWDFGEWLSDTFTATLILALTAAAIVVIAAFVQRKSILVREREARIEVAEAAAILGAGLVPGAPAGAQAGALAPEDEPLAGARSEDPELRALVRRYVDEYLAERGDVAGDGAGDGDRDGANPSRPAARPDEVMG